MHRFHVNTHLVDADQQTPVQGAIPVTLDYVYSQQGLSIEMEHCPLTACLVLPVIAAPSEVADITPEGMRLQKKGRRVGGSLRERQDEGCSYR